MGIAIGSAALILILTVFNGFESLLETSLNSFNPEIKIAPAKGKFIENSYEVLRKLNGINNIAKSSCVLEEVAYFEFNHNSTVGTIKGVDSNYSQVNNIDSIISAGQFKLTDGVNDMGVLGAGLANKLSLSSENRLNPISIYLLDLNNENLPDQNYRRVQVLSSGIFTIPDESEMKYMLVSFDLAKYLIGVENKCSYIESKLKGDQSKTENEIRKILGSGFIVQNRLEQEEELIKIINIERWASYAIVCIVLLLLTFNIIGSLWVIVIEKKKDISVLQAMGADKSIIRRIFIYSGLLISFSGLLIGILLAFIFYFLQKRYGFIGVSEVAIVESYPMIMKITDIIVVTFTVFCIGILVSVIPTHKASKITAFIREE